MIPLKQFVLIVFILALSEQKLVKNQLYSNSWIASGVHDPTCFTQGFSFINNTHILQSCGLNGQSYYHILEYSLTQSNTTTLTEKYRSSKLPRKYFLEGSIYFPQNQMIYILTWTQQVVFRFNLTDHSEILPRLTWSLSYGQGWGMTHNNTHIFISTGKSSIFVVDQNLKVLEALPIVDEAGNQLLNINEIEWVLHNGQQYIYADIWQTTFIVKISIKDRKVVQRFDEAQMVEDSRKYARNGRQDVLNGIAYDLANNVFLLTGKLWPRYYVSFLDLLHI